MSSSIEKLREICQGKLAKLNEQGRLYASLEEYQKRLDHELEIIASLTYENIFLITRQIINHAISKNVIVGPGRGSAAGSMVCYLSGITRGVDPIRFNLRFERFLNHSRVTSADIDVDFSDRDVPINFLKKVYGENKVIQVGTKSLFKIKSALDEFARVWKISFEDAKQITACYDNDGEIIDHATVAKFEAMYPDLFRVARFFGESGRYRNPSKHASAVIVVDEPVGKLIPLQSVEDSSTKKRILTTEWDGDELDAIGYTKFDILKVTSLNVISDTVNYVNSKKPGTLPNATEIFEWVDLKDKKTIELANNADVVGVFQLWKPECIKMFEKLTIREFEDFVLITTVIRPGIDREEFIDCHEHPDKVNYIVPELKPILKDTFGILLFQEQIMDVCHHIAGFTLIQADNIRKAIAKLSKKEDLESYTEKFINGCLAKGISRYNAERMWSEILKRQRYGFNRSHAVSYSLISFVTAYLKAHHPLEFLCACLNDKNEPRFIHQLKKHGFKILPPCVKRSGVDFTIEDDGIRVGLSAIKGVGANAENIVKARPFFGKAEFKSKSRISSDVYTALLSIGAFDCLKEVDEFSNESKKDVNNVRFASEKELLGYYVTGDPLSEYAERFKHCETSDQCRRPKIMIGGKVANIRTHAAAKGEMAFMTVETTQDTFEVVVWPEDWRKILGRITLGSIFVATGLLTTRGSYSLKDFEILKQ